MSADAWRWRSPIPDGPRGKKPNKGAVGCADLSGHLYATKGNNTREFYKYFTDRDSWAAVSGVPVDQYARKQVRAGTDMAFVRHNGEDRVYLVKGGTNEFYCYFPEGDTWTPRARPGSWVGGSKFGAGSWLVTDGYSNIYAHKAKYHELWRYFVAQDSWAPCSPGGMPTYSWQTGQSKKSKDGGAATWYSDG
ncbi:MAG: hypothetical protein ABIK86_07695, partial [candidate division WOR-3 bacterium]